MPRLSLGSIKSNINFCNLIYLNDFSIALRKHAYSNILKILPPKHENFQMKNSYIFHNSAQNIDCGYSLEYPQSMFLSRNKKNNVHPCKPQFYYIKVGFKVVKIMGGGGGVCVWGGGGGGGGGEGESRRGGGTFVTSRLHSCIQTPF